MGRGESNRLGFTAIYYDANGRVVQTRATNHLGGYDCSYIHYDFTGKILKKLKKHKISSSNEITELYTYSYDNGQRLTSTVYSLNGTPGVTLASNSYDELGRLKTKSRHSGKEPGAYQYNIQGWPTLIKYGDFEERLSYNSNTEELVGFNPCYNGNIAGSTWTYCGTTRGYCYYYDEMNRLDRSEFRQGTSTLANGSFDENFTYDNMGNVLGLQRKSNNTLVDNLIIQYINSNKSNKIDYIADVQGLQALNDTKEYQNLSKITSGEFAYDANGNMTKDLDRNIVAIQYNLLNLPEIIQFKNGNQIRNLYDASGQKLGTEYFTQRTYISPLADGQIVNQSYIPGIVDQEGNAYIGNFEYNTTHGNSYYASLSRIYNDEGYVENIASPQYYYYRRDHLGNNREVWLANSNTTKQRTQYYPSGLPWASNSDDDPGLQNKKYNGKEFVEMHGLDEYDSQARWYYPAIMRTTTIDPLAEKYYSISPYAWCGGNSVNRFDPDGMDWYVFGADDNQYQEKLEMEGTHRMAVKDVDKKGNITYTFYDFNDPDADAKAIDNREITQFEIISDAKVEKMIDASGVKSPAARSSRWSYAKNEGVRKMDYGHRGVESGLLNKNTFYVRENLAYNLGDIGNYLWGRGMAELGFDLGVAKMGAHANNALFGKGQKSSLYDFGQGTYGAPSFWDSPGDQRAITNGYNNSPAGMAIIKLARVLNEKLRAKWTENYRTSFSIY